MATYFDPDRDSKIDYTNIKKVLDDALPGYAASGGTFKRPARRYGKIGRASCRERVCLYV